MDVLEYKNCPILVVCNEPKGHETISAAVKAFTEKLSEMGFPVLRASTLSDAELIFSSNKAISCAIIDWSLKPSKLIELMHSQNRNLPIFLVANRLELEKIPLDIVSNTNGYIWLLEDTIDFTSGMVVEAAKKYVDNMLPPFFRELVNYTYEWKYAWHTPGHMGGIAFRKSPSGRFFFDFFGENIFRADLSVSVPELGSPLEHTKVVGKAESEAAHAFGAERTYFVTNGTSTANKIVFHGTVTPGQVVLVDRNCHKSAMHAIIMTGAIPVYFTPTRNQYGIIGPIHNSDFEPRAVRRKLSASTLAKGAKSARLAIITNSTYDGLCYNVQAIKEYLKDSVDCLHFDEAWYGYARFHPLYAGRYAMHSSREDSSLPAIFATQSTHKVLAAFSQGSMIHVKSGKEKINHELFNESFMMHTSTSPQYGIIASLDVAARMMQDDGPRLMDEAMEEAIEFRKKMVETGKREKWWFVSWQPEKINGRPFEKVDNKTLKSNPECWVLKPNDRWHGFGNLEEDHILLDPIKVTILTPGISKEGKMEEFGIPAGIVSRFLHDRGIVVEKTGHYSFLCLFTIGTTKGKAATLLDALHEFKDLYDSDATLEEVFPGLVSQFPHVYKGLTLQKLCANMHAFFVKEKISEIIHQAYSVLPPQEMSPAESYCLLVQGKVQKTRVKDLKGRTSAAMVVPYPPGIPMIMPGEKFSPETQRIIDYLNFCEEFDNEFPEFENEVHGVSIENEGGRKAYYVYCIK